MKRKQPEKSTDNPENVKTSAKPDPKPETAVSEDAKGLRRGDFLSFDLIMKILRDSHESKTVPIGDINFDEERSPDSSSEPEKQDTTPPEKPVQDDRIDQNEPAPESEGSTITVPVDPSISEPPPSFMGRDTNRPPREADLRSLAEYHARKKKP